MKKIFLMISAAVGGLLPFGRADAACTTSYRYSDGSTSSSYNEYSARLNQSDGRDYTKIEDCGNTKTETHYYEKNDYTSNTETTYTKGSDGIYRATSAKGKYYTLGEDDWTTWTGKYSCNDDNYCRFSDQTVEYPTGVKKTYNSDGKLTSAEYNGIKIEYRVKGIYNGVAGYEAFAISSSACKSISRFWGDDAIGLKCDSTGKRIAVYDCPGDTMCNLLDTPVYDNNHMSEDIRTPCNSNTYGSSCETCPSGMNSCHISNGKVVADSCAEGAYANGSSCEACSDKYDSCYIETDGKYTGKLKNICSGENYFYTNDSGNIFGGYDESIDCKADGGSGCYYDCSGGVCTGANGSTIYKAQCSDYTSPETPLPNCKNSLNGKCVNCEEPYLQKDGICVNTCGNGYTSWRNYCCPSNPDNYYYIYNGICKAFPENCSTVTNGVCTSCKKGLPNKDGVCEGCPGNSDDCYVETSGKYKGMLKSYCGQWDDENYFYTDSEGNLLGGYDDSIDCKADGSSGCYYDCSGGVCTGEDGSTISNLSCADYTSPVAALPENCAEGSNGTCTKCNSNYFLKDGACVSDCGDGQYGEDGACKALPENCTAAANGACTTCADSHFLKEGACVSDCGDGQYGENGICNDLPANCKSYSYGCTDCAEGYYVRAGNCDPLPANCSAAADGKCTTCSDGYLEKAGSCVTECGEGYKENFGVCNKVRWTPPEAAAATSDDNTNVVTIMFKK